MGSLWPSPEIENQFDQQMVFAANSELENMIEDGESLAVPGLEPSTELGYLIATLYEPPLRIIYSMDGTMEKFYIFDTDFIAEALTHQCSFVMQPPRPVSMEVRTFLSNTLKMAVSHAPSIVELIPCPAKGRLIVLSLIDRVTGVLVGCGIGQLQPQPAVDENGDYKGLEWYPEVRGFAINTQCRELISEYLASNIDSESWN
ncbi:uncharacterized protein LOC117187191 [Drosophila miranda]|uniref:uncharacterized protein LOC108154378 n=1 Tax=Drosophila miranda TaxID=7229 RepID=UPI0007E6F919|nr:uncharacterized protein LOC108154378 [Drosophila miranda]XP_033245217.1 uncharacterized protein LOC117187191 [Drosophila miranda]